MTREEYIKSAIRAAGFNLKEFAQHIHMPYTTLLSILNGSIGGAAFDNVVKICRPLGIPLDELGAPAPAEGDGSLRLLLASLPAEKKEALRTLLQ